MKIKYLSLALTLASTVVASNASATIYNDTSFDLFDNDMAHLDIVSMEVTNTLTDISFMFTVRGDVTPPDWGKYMILMDTVPGGDANTNGWLRPISMSSGADHFLGAWVDGGDSLELHSWDGLSWTLSGATYNGTPGMSISKSGSTLTLTAPLALLGLKVNDTFSFDAFTSGGYGNDGAVDSLGNPNQQISYWTEHSFAHPLEYTVVPEPGTMAALGLGAAGMICRRRRSAKK